MVKDKPLVLKVITFYGLRINKRVRLTEDNSGWVYLARAFRSAAQEGFSASLIGPAHTLPDSLNVSAGLLVSVIAFIYRRKNYIINKKGCQIICDLTLIF